MALSNDILSQFSKIVNSTPEEKQTKTYGEIVRVGNENYVRIDGSELLTPYERTVTVKEGDRVIVNIENHTATITGNVSDPSYSSSSGESMNGKIDEFDIIISHKITTDEIEAITGYFEQILATYGEFDELNAIKAMIEQLKATYINVDHLNAKDIEAISAEIEHIIAETINVDVLDADEIDAIYGYFESIKAYNANFVYVSAEVLEAMQAQIKNLKVENLDAEYAKIDFANITEAAIKKLKADFADIDLANITVAAIDNLTAKMVDIDFATINEATIKSLEAKYANIDFANIGDAAIKKILADSGIIKDLVIENGAIITGELVGVTIKGDIIEGGTIKADKLVVKGEDGLFYKLNTSGEGVVAEQTEYNSLDGSVITAKSITADRVNVSDLVAFDATIGGFNITEESLYSGVKESIHNTTRGVYLDKEGQFAVGDSLHYMKYYKDKDEKGNDIYKLEITADSVLFKSTNKTIEETMNDINKEIEDSKKMIEAGIKTITNEYAQNQDPETAPTSGWSTNTPKWKDGNYIWTRSIVEYNDGSKNIGNPVCITGATGQTGLDGIQGPQGEQGIPGPKGDPGDSGDDGQTSYFHIKYSDVANPTLLSQIKDTPDIYIGTYVDFIKNDATEPSKYTWYRFQGLQGEDGKQGIPGTNGTNGKTSYLHIAYADDYSGTVGFTTTNATNKEYIGQYTDFNMTDSTDPSDYTWSKFRGDPGAQGPQGEQGIPGTPGTNGQTTYFHIKYSAVANPSFADQISDIPNKYIGTYVDFIQQDSTDPSKYTWYKFQGEDGPQGIPGTNGDNGKTSYLHIAYATNDTGTSGFSTSVSSGKTYIGVYVDFELSDSTDPTKYTWSKILGDNGKGIKSITEQYYLSTSNTSCTGGSWSTIMPEWVKGRYIWMRLKTEWTYDGTTVVSTTYSDPYLAEAINNSNEEIDVINGKINKWVKTVDQYYTISDSGETLVNYNWQLGIPTGSSYADKYIWAKYHITYNDGTISETQPRLIRTLSPLGTPTVVMSNQTETEYNFIKNGDWYQNTNQQVNSTTCKSTFTVTNYNAGSKRIGVEFTQDSEINYDYLTINGSSQKGKTSGTYTYTISGNTTVVWEISYVKDSSQSNGTDTAQFRFTYLQDYVSSAGMQYYISSSNTGLVDGSWTSCSVSITQNEANKTKYIWVREQLNLSDSQIVYTTPFLVGPCYVNLGYMVSELEQCLNSTFGTTPSGWEMAFQIITNNMQNLSRYIRFENGHIILGEEGNAVTLKIENDIIAFYQFGQRVAYLSDGELKASRATIDTTLNLGNFEFVPGKKGNLTFRRKVIN